MRPHTRWRRGSGSSSRSWSRRPVPVRASCARSTRSDFICSMCASWRLPSAQGLPLMTICNTCTLNLLDAHAAFAEEPELAGRDQFAAGGGGPALQRTHAHQPFPLGALRGHRHRAAAATGRQSAHRADGRGLLRLPHHAPAGALRFRRFTQQHGVGAACRDSRMPADRLQRAHRMLRIPHRRPRRAGRDQADRAAHQIGEDQRRARPW